MSGDDDLELEFFVGAAWSVLRLTQEDVGSLREFARFSGLTFGVEDDINGKYGVQASFWGAYLSEPKPTCQKLEYHDGYNHIFQITQI